MVLEGLLTILSLKNLFYIALATAGGLAIGALPGLTATMGVALLVPLSFTMGPVSGLAVLGAIYMSAIYGGCFSAILINTPGTPGSIATAFDGYPMARKGEGDKAIFAATYASMIGGLLSLIALFFLSPPLARIALKFGPPEYFWLAIFGMTVISSLGEGSVIKTFLSGGVGLLLSCIGVTRMGGELRFGFGWYQLQGGVELVAALIGLFCIPEALNFMGQSATSIYDMEKIKKKKRFWFAYFREFWGTRLTLFRSTLIGIIIGILPGAGGTIANVVAYNDAKTYSKKSGFGTGIMDGVVAPESANNATVGGGLIPTPHPGRSGDTRRCHYSRGTDAPKFTTRPSAFPEERRHRVLVYVGAGYFNTDDGGYRIIHWGRHVQGSLQSSNPISRSHHYLPLDHRFVRPPQ